MTDNVIGLNGAATGQKEVCPGAVKSLEDALEAAKSGEVIGVYVISRHFDGTASWSGGGRAGGFTMLGAIECAKQDLVAINRGEDGCGE